MSITKAEKEMKSREEAEPIIKAKLTWWFGPTDTVASNAAEDLLDVIYGKSRLKLLREDLKLCGELQSVCPNSQDEFYSRYKEYLDAAIKEEEAKA